MATRADLVPVLVGLNVTLIAQLTLLASVAGQLCDIVNWFALVPASATLVSLNVPLPVFVNVITWDALATLMTWLPNARDVGFTLATGTGGVCRITLLYDSAVFVGKPTVEVG